MEIKFRGISTLEADNKEFVYGYYLKMESARLPRNLGGEDRHIIISQDKETGSLRYETPIKEETLGQYIGIRDKNGKEIYTGDIVVFGVTREKYRGVIRYGEYFIDPCELCEFDLDSEIDIKVRGVYIETKHMGCVGITKNKAGRYLEVAGNIHEK